MLPRSSARSNPATLVLTAMLAISSAAARAQTADADAQASATTLVPHPPDRGWWLSGQVNLISQWHGRFTSPYEGENSLRSAAEQALSRVWTIYTGVALPGRTELLFDVESAGGRGLSDALGLAGFTNLDVVRNPSLGATPYVARAMIHTTLALDDETIAASPGPLGFAARVPARRIEIRVGKLGIADFFDVNASGSDSHLQFTNWAIDNNGAYDYAADTRGYTWAAIVEYASPQWSLRFAEALMPTVANGITFDWNLSRSRGENLEVELHPTPALAVRLLGYANHANMGSYDEAIRGFLSGRDARPDIEAHRAPSRVKTGAGANVEYTSPRGVRLFGRAGWNEGHHESFAYTEVNDTVQAGGDVAGAAWRRAGDRAGAAVVSNGLSAPHRDYLALGGLGFLLGDGALGYGRETIVELYYTARLRRGVSAAAGVQRIDNPGYNRDRGPVVVGMLRLHLEL